MVRTVVRLVRFASGFAGTATFKNEASYIQSLAARGALPAGFRVGTHKFTFRPHELPHKTAPMTLTLIALDKPTSSWAAMFTSNAFPGAPVIVGRKRLAGREGGGMLQAIVINNKISNVCAPGGVDAAETVCAAAAKALSLSSPSLVLPCSTGIIGWRIPVADLTSAMPAAAASLQGGSILPAASGICTTDLYPKVRSAVLPNGSRIVGIAKGAGMIEPNLATMLVYVLTDADIPAQQLQEMLKRAAAGSFNALSIDSDQSTSDTAVLLSSRAVPTRPELYGAFEEGLTAVCADLAADIVRNGEGVQHVMRVRVTNAGTPALAAAVGKAVVNSPLFKCAVAGNDPNVGRLVSAIGSCVGKHPDGGRTLDLSNARLSLGGRVIFSGGVFALPPEAETELVAHLRAAQLWETTPTVASGAPATAVAEGSSFPGPSVSYPTPVTFPPHERMVEVGVDLGLGSGGSATILGADLTHEYIACNADYRS
jgi:glutamate N-acetyltransferase/amino-acid N-acetyltransferase